MDTSRHWTDYAIQHGQEHFPEHVLGRLTLKQGLKDLMAFVGMDGTPFRKAWYERKFVELSGNDLEPAERWMNLTALLGLVHHKFSGVKFQIPQEWIEGHAFAKKEYMFCMVDDFSDWSFQSSEWDHKFHAPERVYFDPGKKNPWLLRTELADEFTGLYFDKVRELIAAIGKAATPEETLKQHRALREHVDEASWYDRMMLLEKIRLKLPAFSSEYTASTDPAVRFAIAALNEICTFKGESSRDVCKILVNSYWDRLKDISKGAEAKKIIDLIQFEVMELIEAQEAINEKGGKT